MPQLPGHANRRIPGNDGGRLSPGHVPDRRPLVKGPINRKDIRRAERSGGTFTEQEPTSVVTYPTTLIAATGTTSNFGCEAYSRDANAWGTRSDSPVARVHTDGAAANGKVYTAGGYNAGAHADMHIYDPEVDVWGPKASMPDTRQRHGMTALNGDVYVVGGRDSAGNLGSNNFQYDPGSDSWSTIPAATHPSEFPGVTTIGGRVWKVGGWTNVSGQRKLEAYDPEVGGWGTFADMPTGRYGLVAVAARGKIWAIGGDDANNADNVVESYDPNTDTWETGHPAMPTGRYHAAGSVTENRYIHVIGGQTFGTRHEILDLETMTWETATLSPTSHEENAVVAAV